eukprot:GHUV01021594.1.p1 GENE.GHUV01021594.1~~GHUV01021594.1.p1  ORF type:complete len:143 (-),score=28.79 GHUV01021594.1:675-1103(-)
MGCAVSLLACTCCCCLQQSSGQKEPVTLLHRKAEDTKLPAGSFDVVSMCLVAHELPQHATRDILKEAYRLVQWPWHLWCSAHKTLSWKLQTCLLAVHGQRPCLHHCWVGRDSLPDFLQQQKDDFLFAWDLSLGLQQASRNCW